MLSSSGMAGFWGMDDFRSKAGVESPDIVACGSEEVINEEERACVGLILEKQRANV